MESVAGVEGEYRTQGADAVVGIRMLKQELDSDTNRERRGNWNGHPEEDQWQDATGGFESLMHGVLIKCTTVMPKSATNTAKTT